MLFVARKFPPPKTKLLQQNYAKKTSSNTKKPRAPKKQTNISGQNVLMEYDNYYNNPRSNIGLTTYDEDEKEETGLAPQMELPKELVFDQKSLEKEMAKSLAGAIINP